MSGKCFQNKSSLGFREKRSTNSPHPPLSHIHYPISYSIPTLTPTIQSPTPPTPPPNLTFTLPKLLTQPSISPTPLNFLPNPQSFLHRQIQYTTHNLTSMTHSKYLTHRSRIQPNISYPIPHCQPHPPNLILHLTLSTSSTQSHTSSHI